MSKRIVFVFHDLQELENTSRKEHYRKYKRNEPFGYVYIVEYGKDIKIGFSQEIWTRLHTLESQARNYGSKKFGRIAFCDAVENYRLLEKHLHLRFWNKRTTRYAELFHCRFEKAIDALETEQAEPYLIELPEYDHKRKVNANRNPRGSGARLRNTIKALYSL